MTTDTEHDHEDSDDETETQPETCEVPPELEQLLREERAKQQQLLTDLGKALDKMIRDEPTQ